MVLLHDAQSSVNTDGGNVRMSIESTQLEGLGTTVGVFDDRGSKVPYFVMRREDLTFDGSNPTLVDAYGGFEISLTPGYSAGVGVGWLERGGVKVIANIRGGGEYGPRWHQAALKAKRFKAYEDLEAVAQDVVDRGISSPPKLAVIGGSNGGLMVGNAITRPRASALFGAAVCQVPLLDMKRYSHLLAGASWRSFW